MKRPDIATGVVVNKKGEVVVVNQNHNSWSLPKGHIEKGEDPLAAAKREINSITCPYRKNFYGIAPRGKAALLIADLYRPDDFNQARSG